LEDESLNLIELVPESNLACWLAELYGKKVEILKRETLRHRDLSFVERLHIKDGFPKSVIYKLVLPPFDIEHELHQRVLVPSITNFAQLYLTAHYGKMTAMLMEDLGEHSLLSESEINYAQTVGRDLAKMHRGYSYRIDDLLPVDILPHILPIDYEQYALRLAKELSDWQLISQAESKALVDLAGLVASKLAGEPISLVHGDLYAENLIIRHNRLYIIDWSHFAFIGVPLMDLGTLTIDHVKNGHFAEKRAQVIEAYCDESGRDAKEVLEQLPYAAALSRLIFLSWLVERKSRGITGTTVGPVEILIAKVTNELCQLLKNLS
jgi:tRNA A-37 threonylcarbamoyl transferase component Bud32